MPKVRALVPIEDEDGPIGVGQVFDANDEKAAALRAAGKVSLISDEERNEKAAAEGHYSEVTGREKAAGSGSGGKPPGPQADDEPPKKGKQ